MKLFTWLVGFFDFIAFRGSFDEDEGYVMGDLPRTSDLPQFDAPIPLGDGTAYLEG
jgi:hypothetical protein